MNCNVCIMPLTGKLARIDLNTCLTHWVHEKCLISEKLPFDCPICGECSNSFKLKMSTLNTSASPNNDTSPSPSNPPILHTMEVPVNRPTVDPNHEYLINNYLIPLQPPPFPPYPNFSQQPPMSFPFHRYPPPYLPNPILPHLTPSTQPTPNSTTMPAEPEPPQMPEGGNYDRWCQICGESFRTRCQKSRHMVSHRPKETYKCPRCGSNYGSFQSMRKHQKKHDHYPSPAK